MPQEKSVGVVVIHRTGKNIFYLLLHYPATARAKHSYWDLPKGHVEEGENELDTAKREVREETGVQDLRFVRGFRETIRYFFRVEGKTVFKMVAFYLAETRKEKIQVSHEHTGYVWLSYREATKQVKFQNAKDVITKAHNLLSKKSSSGRKKDSKRKGKNV
ncbi:NUDIX domain-containing protein [Patescibacteria group bacterium]|nr:NUDIX domain-containing protein [Patescibacteria group bacterium]